MLDWKLYFAAELFVQQQLTDLLFLFSGVNLIVGGPAPQPAHSGNRPTQHAPLVVDKGSGWWACPPGKKKVKKKLACAMVL
jgi:hypothetical protein